MPETAEADRGALQGEVLGLLQNFNGTEPLKELFWSTLNYDRINRPTSRRKWPQETAAVLVDDPILLAAGGAHGGFQVLYSRLAKDRLSLTDERAVTGRLLKDHPYSLFIFSDRQQANWHFLNVKQAEDEAKRQLFRRITVGPNEKLRTATQIISQLDLNTISPNLFGLSPLLIQDRHDKAFDVERVTEEFFRQYHATFTQVEGMISGIRDEDRKRLFTQRLFNRLMFMAFIQKKGWLQFAGKKNHDYLNDLWSDYKKCGNKQVGFYQERLSALFFHGLAKLDSDKWADIIGKVPYLNGGLFEEDEDDKDGTITVPDKAIDAVLHGLFDHFNFTVTEATPLDIEVAVDPEMLGKVFEELVTGRHETGSYYTPKPIVSFMCREALKGYLESNLTKEEPGAIAGFVDKHEPGGLHDAESALEMLRRVRVCDPACGSGAYLLGMLHELMDLRSCLFKTKQLDSIRSYDRKLDIIQHNLYGVDLDLFAVNIARLRLWLSLAVEFDGESPEPLPNLKFEIEQGDSVSAPGPQPVQELLREAAVKEFAATKALYIKAHGEHKKQLEAHVIDLKREITTWTHGKDHVAGFDWPVEFAEVFEEHGFDIVVANPPYVRQELIIDQKSRLKSVFPEVYNGTADLFVFFYARALQILKPGGMLCFISSNKWFRANYGANLRKHLSSTCSVRSITDFGDLPVFKSTAAYPMIFIASRTTSLKSGPIFTDVRSIEAPYPDVLEIVKRHGSSLPRSAVTGGTWVLTDAISANRLQTMSAKGVPLGEYAKGNIYRGVVTGLNEAFVIDRATRDRLIAEDRSSRELIKPLVRGKDIRRWRVEPKDHWLIFTRRGVMLNDYPAIKRHLTQWKKELEPRPSNWPIGTDWQGRKPGRYKWHEIQDEVAYFKYFGKPKIVFPDIAKSLRFAFDPNGLWSSNTTYFICSDDLYLLGVLNSGPVEELYIQMSSQIRGGYLRFFTQYVEKIPIPDANSSTKEHIRSLVRHCMDADGNGCDNWESELNVVVSELYGVSLREQVRTS